MKRPLRSNLRQTAMRIGLTAALASAFIVVGCDSSSSNSTLGLPLVSPIVEGATPSVFKTAVAAFIPGTDLQQAPLRSACSVTNDASFRECLLSLVLSPTAPDGALGQWYLHWVRSTDEKVKEFNSRFSSTLACLSTTPIDMEFDFSGTGKMDLTGLGPVSTKLQCWESLSLPEGETGTADMAFSVVDGETTIVQRVVKPGTSNGSGSIMTIAKVNSAGNEAKIWVLLSSYQSGNKTAIVNRILSNSETKAFAIDWLTTDVDSNRYRNFFLRSNGTDSMHVSGKGGAAANHTYAGLACARPDSLTTAGTDCSTLGLFPDVGLGPTALLTSGTMPAPGATNALYDTMNVLASESFADAGLTKIE